MIRYLTPLREYLKAMTEHETEFETQLTTALDESHPVAAAGLMFLSDLASADRATLDRLWGTASPERRRKIATILVQVAEDNIEYDFNGTLNVLLGDPDAEVRRTAVEGLTEDESNSTVRHLLDLLETDPDAGVRAATALTLGPAALRAETGKIKADLADRIRTVLLQATRDTAQPLVRRRALESLGYFCENVEVEAEIRRAYTEGGDPAASALAAMGRNMNSRWTPTLVKELRNSRPQMRFEAAQALGELGDRNQVPALLPLLEDDDPEVQRVTIWALGQIGGRAAQQALQGLGSDLPADLQGFVDDALAEIRHSSSPLSP
jgi:HEAT repeat protein